MHFKTFPFTFFSCFFSHPYSSRARSSQQQAHFLMTLAYHQLSTKEEANISKRNKKFPYTHNLFIYFMLMLERCLLSDSSGTTLTILFLFLSLSQKLSICGNVEFRNVLKMLYVLHIRALAIECDLYQQLDTEKQRLDCKINNNYSCNGGYQFMVYDIFGKDRI